MKKKDEKKMKDSSERYSVSMLLSLLRELKNTNISIVTAKELSIMYELLDLIKKGEKR